METKKMLNFGRTILGIINATNEALLEHALFYFLSIYRRMKARLLRPKKKRTERYNNLYGKRA
jgi:hypothetical protein